MTIESGLAWPPAFTVKRHRLARRVTLRACNQKGLEITVPKRYSLNELPAVLEEHKIWILKQLAQITSQQSAPLPTNIHLPALNQHWQISFLPSDTRSKLFIRTNNEFVLMGKTIQSQGKKLLIQALKKIAQKYLSIELDKVSDETQLPFRQLTIRDQRARWGSCTHDGSISLNYKLIFLPFYLMRHIMVHELCHTIYLNHSKAFWQLVANHDSEWEKHRKLLRKGDQYIPPWVI